MKWFVSRKSFDGAVASAMRWYNLFLETEAKVHGLECQLAACRHELAHTIECYNGMRQLEEQERHRRLALQGEVQYRDERIKRVLGLPGFSDAETEKAS
jgi:hypothetical protein